MERMIGERSEEEEEEIYMEGHDERFLQGVETLRHALILL